MYKFLFVLSFFVNIYTLLHWCNATKQNTSMKTAPKIGKKGKKNTTHAHANKEWPWHGSEDNDNYYGSQCLSDGILNHQQQRVKGKVQEKHAPKKYVHFFVFFFLIVFKKCFFIVRVCMCGIFPPFFSYFWCCFHTCVLFYCVAPM